MKKFFNSNKTVYIILCLVILAGICRFSYGFFVEKQGTHSDEEWSFGLANSYYEPYIYSSDDDNYDKNCNEWLSGEVLKNYLTVWSFLPCMMHLRTRQQPMTVNVSM